MDRALCLLAGITFDIATPLTMVLAERTMLIERSSGEAASAEAPIWYLHGLGLLAQSDGTNTEYLMTDGLGSVRQMVGASGSVLLAQTFDPYGTLYGLPAVAQSFGGTSYGYTEEQSIRFYPSDRMYWLWI